MRIRSVVSSDQIRPASTSIASVMPTSCTAPCGYSVVCPLGCRPVVALSVRPRAAPRAIVIRICQWSAMNRLEGLGFGSQEFCARVFVKKTERGIFVWVFALGGSQRNRRTKPMMVAKRSGLSAELNALTDNSCHRLITRRHLKTKI